MAIERPVEIKTCEEIERKMQAGFQAFNKNQESLSNLDHSNDKNQTDLSRRKRAFDFNTDIRLEFHEKYSTKITLHVLNDRYTIQY